MLGGGRKYNVGSREIWTDIDEKAIFYGDTGNLAYTAIPFGLLGLLGFLG